MAKGKNIMAHRKSDRATRASTEPQEGFGHTASVPCAALRWRRVPYTMGQYETECGEWAVYRYHDERDNFYVVSHLGREIREFRNNLERAFEFANASATEAEAQHGQG